MRKTRGAKLGAVLGLAICAAASPSGWASSVDTATYFEQLKQGLVGEWTGTLQPIDKPVAATFYLSGNGSALVEDIRRLDKDWRMLTVYHLNGAELRLTHFCSFRNQPRLRATTASQEGEGLEIEFDLVDVTNLAESGPRYTHRMLVSLIDPDHASVTYFGFEQGKETGYLTAELERVPREDLVHQGTARGGAARYRRRRLPAFGRVLTPVRTGPSPSLP